MKIQFKQVAMTLVLSSALLMTGLPALAEGTDAAVAQTVAAPVYQISDSLQVVIEGVSSEKTANGVRLGSVIRIMNTSNQTLRIPDYELKVKTTDGTIYTLRPSSSNAHGVQPESEVELTYLKVINRQTEVDLSNLSLIDVNYDVYPKQETLLLSAPIDGVVWNGNRGEFKKAPASIKWGETFSIPTVASPLQYKTVDITRSNSNEGAVYVVKLLVTNPNDQAETLPAIELDGKSKTNLYAGKQVEDAPVVLDAGQSKYVHYAIHADMDTVLNSINVLTSESFTQADAAGNVKTSAFTIGKLNVEMPGAAGATGSYTYGTPITFEKWNDVINQDLDVALVELHVTDNKDQGSKVAFAKFTLTNKGVSDIPVPAFQTMLSSPTGYDYTGSRQNDAQKSIAPGTSTVVSYAFVLPVSETSDTYTMKVQNEIKGQTGGESKPTFKSTIASYKVAVQEPEDRHEISLYPYTVNLKDYMLSQITVPGQTIALNYTYKLQLYMDLIRDPKVLVDNSFSKLKFELVDRSGTILGSKIFPFTGTDRLVNGKQTLTFSNLTTDQLQNNVLVNVYEVLNTPSGEVDRLIAELK
ncbi:hypothetical protein HZF08_09015 [Paenibacillus sp. CGMCC 1.16610]|uniref:DUF11 domain-containing protein n=1 Tax=Paenibacillus anseongense TaxID=2682845 RepID=A0ABW9UE84_9BACL|nr:MULTISPECIES: hypothetical protein [Paenibacillus]MBA2938450.1 hypothetical protein [Paenibacillus sp. CGMCC 1.16610]MVQ37508.1 hypothetical protein [Paenibacillus anseongense]